MDIQIYLSKLFDTSELSELWNPTAILYLFAILVVFWIGKKINDIMTPYDLNKELTEVDNKAVALSFSGYLLSIGIILWGVLASDSSITPSDNPKRDLLMDIANTALWGFIGIILLELARIINDKLLLNKFNNVKELTEDKNIGTGAVQAGSFIGTAFIIKASLTGEDESTLWISICMALVYFIVAQIAFILFSKIYQLISAYDLHAEIEKDNYAAGISFGMTLVAVGIILSSYIIKYDSLIGLFIWFMISSILLVGFRTVIDKCILPGKKLDDEISIDQNWGAALVEGCSAIALALLLATVY